MAQVYREAMSDEIHIILKRAEYECQPKGRIYEKIEDALVEDFIDGNGQKLLASIDINAVANALALKVAEVMAKKLVEGK